MLWVGYNLAPFTRAQIASLTVNVSTFLVCGFSSLNDLGHGAVYTSVGANSGGPMAIQDASGTWFNLVVNGATEAGWWGAKGDGANEDLAPILLASNYLGAHGGGKLRFRAGRYRSTITSSILVRNNVEYCGDGYASWLDFTWNVFAAPDELSRGNYGSLTYYAANDVATGDQAVVSTTHGNAAHFAANDIVMIRSTAFRSSGGSDVEPYYIEHNRVVAANASTGVITLEDPIDDGWSGVEIANVTPYFSQNYHIHDLRVSADWSEGSTPFHIDASYKGVIENCWQSNGAKVLSCNAFVRSVMRNIIATQTYYTGYIAPILELATGTVRGLVENLQVYVCNFDGATDLFTCVYLQEYSRRTCVKNMTVSAPEVDMDAVISLSTGGGHEISDFAVKAKSAQALVRYSGVVSAAGAPALLPVRLSGLRAEFQTYYMGIQLSGSHGTAIVKNLSVDSVYLGAVAATRCAIGMFCDLTNVRFNNVYANGTLTDQGGVAPYSYSNVVVSNSVLSAVDPLTNLTGVTQSAVMTGTFP